MTDATPTPTPQPAHRPLDTRAASLMVALCVAWGFQQVAIKAVAADLAPTLQIALRSGVAALLVAALMKARGERLTPGAWKPGLVVAALFGLEFLLIGQGLQRTSAGHMSVFLYTAPIFAALGLHARLPAERLRPLQWLGIAIAFGGIALAFAGRGGGAAGGTSFTGDAMAVAAGAAWGFTTVAVRVSRLATTPATETLLYQLAGAFVLLLALAALTGQLHATITPLALASLAFQSIVVSFASYLTWFALLKRYLASRLGVFSFLTPLFGVGFGAWLLHEPVEGTFLAGGAMVLAGISAVMLLRR